MNTKEKNTKKVRYHYHVPIRIAAVISYFQCVPLIVLGVLYHIYHYCILIMDLPTSEQGSVYNVTYSVYEIYTFDGTKCDPSSPNVTREVGNVFAGWHNLETPDIFSKWVLASLVINGFWFFSTIFMSPACCSVRYKFSCIPWLIAIVFVLMFDVAAVSRFAMDAEIAYEDWKLLGSEADNHGLLYRFIGTVSITCIWGKLGLLWITNIIMFCLVLRGMARVEYSYGSVKQDGDENYDP